jgi:hypothetical protein
MRGFEQRVERKIRLWVVQQERNRLRESRGERATTRADESTPTQSGPTDVRTAQEGWRLG